MDKEEGRKEEFVWTYMVVPKQKRNTKWEE